MIQPFPDLDIEVPSTVGYSKPGDEWVMGANLRTGTCSWTEFGNHHACVTGFNGSREIMPDGEILHADSAMTGYDPNDRTTDHGIALETMLDDMMLSGWPGDPELRPRRVWSLRLDQVPRCIHALAGAICWFMLPQRDRQWDFSQGAVDLGLPGIGPHAMYTTHHQSGIFKVVTWAEEIEVTDAWFRSYFRGGFGVWHPQWKLPAGMRL